MLYVTKCLHKIKIWRSMKEHIQVKKPYTYSYCDKKFAENQNMKMHERINISKKPLEYIVTNHVNKMIL